LKKQTPKIHVSSRNPLFILPLGFDDHFKAQMNLRGTRWQNPGIKVKVEVEDKWKQQLQAAAAIGSMLGILRLRISNFSL
jgi:hypothetical protein